MAKKITAILLALTIGTIGFVMPVFAASAGDGFDAYSKTAQKCVKAGSDRPQM
jgi:hypothetical protein